MPYDNPKGIIAESIILEIFAVTCVGLRFLARRKRGASLATDDWLIVAALVGATGLTVMQIWGCATGVLGVPLNLAYNDVPALTGRIGKAEHIELATIALGVPTLGCTRLSFAFLYKRIFISRKFQIVIWTWIALVITWTVAFELVGLLECGSHLWALFSTPATYHHYCGSAIHAGYAMVGSSVAQDVITVILPLPMLSTLQMPRSRKILLTLTCMIGLLSVGAGIGKAYIYVTASIGISTLDGITTITGFSVWNLIEVHVGIMVSCSFMMRPIIQNIRWSDSFDNLLSYLRRPFTSQMAGSRTSKVLSGPSDESFPGLASGEQLVTTFPKINSQAKATSDHIPLSDRAKNRLGAPQDNEIRMDKHVVVERAE